jgi:glycogen synthase
VDARERPEEGTGFVFDAATPAALVAAVARAAAMRADDPVAWEALRDRGMAVDFNWVSGSAPRYLEAYRRAIIIRQG